MQTMTAEDYLNAYLADPAGFGIVSFTLAAELLGVSRQSVSHDVQAGALSGIAIKTSGGKLTKGVRIWSVQKKLEMELVLEKILEDRAQKGGALLEYGKDLMQPIGMDHHKSNDRKKLGLMLAHISTRSVRKHKYMLSALAVAKKTERPNQTGFYSCDAAKEALKWAIREGRLTGKAKHFLKAPDLQETFFRDQIQQIEQHYQTQFNI